VTPLFVATGDALARVADGHSEAVLQEPGVQCVAVDARSPERVLAGCRGGGVFESEDGGATWRDAALPATDVFSVAYSPADGAAYAGCEPSALWLRHNGEWDELSALRELPSAPTWSFPPRPWTSHVPWIAPSPHDAKLILAGIELGGLMRSADGGATWQDHRPGAQRDVHTLAWHPNEQGRAYEAAGGGSAWSRDDGDTWEPVDDGATATTRGRSPLIPPIPTAGSSRRPRARSTPRAAAPRAPRYTAGEETGHGRSSTSGYLGRSRRCRTHLPRPPTASSQLCATAGCFGATTWETVGARSRRTASPTSSRWRAEGPFSP
jgi:hypothetical protein